MLLHGFADRVIEDFVRVVLAHAFYASSNTDINIALRDLIRNCPYCL